MIARFPAVPCAEGDASPTTEFGNSKVARGQIAFNVGDLLTHPAPVIEYRLLEEPSGLERRCLVGTELADRLSDSCKAVGQARCARPIAQALEGRLRNSGRPVDVGYGEQLGCEAIAEAGKDRFRCHELGKHRNSGVRQPVINRNSGADDVTGFPVYVPS